MVVNLTPRLQTIKQYSVELRHGDSISLESCSYHICRPESKHVMWKMVMQPRMQSPFIGHSNWVEITIDNNVTIPLATRTSIVQKKHELYHSLCIINHRIYISSVRIYINIQQKMASSWIVQLMVLLWPKFKVRHSKLDAVELDSWQILGPVDICIYIYIYLNTDCTTVSLPVKHEA